MHRMLVEEGDDDFSQQRHPKKNRKALFIGIGISIAVLSVLLLIIGLATTREQDGAPSMPTEAPVPEPSPPYRWDQLRLPTSAGPISYDIRVEPNFNDFTFTVHQKVEFWYHEPGEDLLVMHAKGLNITHAKLYRPSAEGVSTDLTSLEYNDKYELVLMTWGSLHRWTEEGDREFLLELEYTGVMGDDMRGFYRSQYSENGQHHWMAVTQFEPTDARRAFVSFDEPAFKAVFNITLVSDPGWEVLSNMPQHSITTLSSGKKEVKFEPSVPMSTYLVCYIFCQFQAVHGTVLGKNVSVWTTPETLSETSFALEVAMAALHNYTDYFGIEYPLPKLDLIAIPDYSVGAMENWGLITFRQTALLYDTVQSSASDQQRVAVVICHEIAHQWFGNFVTMKWWSDLWLNEGFASYMEYVGMNAQLPEWDVVPQRLLDRQGAMHLDALPSSHPVAVTITSPDEISQQFDSISYDKGASIIAMLNSYLSDKDPKFFTDGLNQYLNSHAYSNAETADLWKAISDISGDAVVTPMMNSWTSQKNFPYVTLVQTNPTTVTATQKLFLESREPYDENAVKWWIPLSYVTPNHGSAQVNHLILSESSATLSYSPASDGPCLLVNVDGTGYYRVKYTGALLTGISDMLDNVPPQIGVAARAAIVNDAFSFSLAHMDSPVDALNAMKFLKKEKNFVVWVSALNGFGSIDRLVELQPYYGKWKKYVLSLLDEVKEYVGWTVDPQQSHDMRLIRPMILANAGRYGDSAIDQQATILFKNFSVDENAFPIHSDLRTLVYNAAMGNGGEYEFEWLLQRYMTSSVPAEKRRCLGALSHSTQYYLLARLLQLSLDVNYVRPQDSVSVIAGVAANPHGRYLAWDFFRDHYKDFEERYGGSAFEIGNLVNYCTRYFNTEVKLKEVEEFFATHPLSGASRSVNQTLDAISANVQWIKANSNLLRGWLDANV